MIVRRHLLTFLVLLLCGCARQTTPGGGPQDKTPPVLVRSTPANNQLNFKGKTLTFQFDEPVRLKEPKEEFIIAPKAKDLIFSAKQNKVTIESKEGWQDSTTYSIAFREGVQDLTESNPAENLRIAFSTGPVIDSLRIRGNIVDALTEKIPQKITVAIYQSDTFDIFKHQPAYFTKTDKEGNFIITNLKAGVYRVYAFNDANKNLKLETKSEAFGFIPGKVALSGNIDTLHLIMINLDTRPIRLTNIRHSEKISQLKFNKSLTQYTALIPGKNILNTFGDDHSEIKFFHHLPPPDSLAMTFHGTDSLDQTIDTLVYLKAGTFSTVAEGFKTTLSKPTINVETGIFDATLTFNKPLSRISRDSIFLNIDSLTQFSFSPDELLYDTALNKIQFSKKLDNKILSVTTPIEFLISANSFISIETDSSKKISQKITIPRPEDTATLLLEINTTKKDYVVQLLTTDYKTVQTSSNQKKITFRNLPPAEYKVRVFLDLNKNNQWDPGNINKDQAPEPSIYYKTAGGKYQFPLRANWEVGPYTITF